MPSIENQLGQRALPRRKGDRPDAGTANPERMRKILVEKRRRAVDTLKILTLTAKQKAAIENMARIRLFLGANRAGKTSIALMDAALIVCGWHPTRKYKEGYHGRLYFVGKDAKALGEVFYRKLRGWGEFKIIRDKQTKKWRSYNPNEEPERSLEAEMAPPLIPDRFIHPSVKEGSTFRIFKTKELKKLVVKNDLGQIWHLDFFTSEGDPPRGANIDGVYFSEEIENPEWYNEMRMRITDRRGFMLWDAAQQDGSDALSELENRADEEINSPNPAVWKTRWSLYDNPYLAVDSIEEAKRDLTSEQDIRVRIYGEAATKKIRCFPEFAAATHTFRRQWLPKGNVPLDWTRYMGFDPGYEAAAAIFVAIPPPEYEFHPKLYLVYDEIYSPGASVEENVALIARKMEGQSIRAFFFDENQCSKHESAGVTIGSQYLRAMREKNVRSEANGVGYFPGFDDTAAGAEIVRSAMRKRYDDMPYLMILEDTCVNLVKELRSLKRATKRSKRRNMIYLDTPADGQDDHAYDALRYVLGGDPKYHKPRPGKSPRDLRYERYLRWQRGQERQSSVVLGPRRRQPEEVLQ